MHPRLQHALSRSVGAAADLPVPRFLRGFVYRTFARQAGARLDEVRDPLDSFPSVGAFFVRHLKAGARTFSGDPNVLPAPCDGRLQAYGRVERGALLQAKGSSYELAALLAGAAGELALEGGTSFTIYLAPSDYHRVHCPLDAELRALHWVPGALHSVRPSVLAARARVFTENERCVLRFASPRGPFFLVMVGALNVGRIRVCGIEGRHSGELPRPLRFARGAELARFELGSTVVLVFPPGGPVLETGLQEGVALRMGSALGRY
jgi:phosphatidylserine decarboxylase